MDDVDRCVCCGAVIPEGRQVCPLCEKGTCMHLWAFDRIVTGQSGQRYLSWKCQRCGQSRLERPGVRERLWNDDRKESGLLEED